MSDDIQKIIDGIPAEKAADVMEALRRKHFEHRTPLRYVERPVELANNQGD